MGVYIKGMEMPQNCAECPMCYDMMECSVSPLKFWNGRTEIEQFDFCNERHPDCPLVELPEHGDLIDRDTLKRTFCAHCDGYEYETGACVDGDQDCMDAKIIKYAPVIIPADKEETE